MLGYGRIGIAPDETGQEGSLSHAVKEKGLYPYLLMKQATGEVRNVQVMGSGLGEMHLQ